MKQKFTNGTLTLTRQLLSIPGVAKTAAEIYQDGELLCVVLPELDMKWMKSDQQVAVLSLADQGTYEAESKKWAMTDAEVELTEKQRDRIKAVLNKAPTLIDMQQTKWLFQLYQDFGVVP